MHIGMLGGGTIAKLFLQHIARGDLGDAQIVAILGRPQSERSKKLAQEHRIAYVTDTAALIAQKPSPSDAVAWRTAPLFSVWPLACWYACTAYSPVRLDSE